jgi:hypothetical protein
LLAILRSGLRYRAQDLKKAIDYYVIALNDLSKDSASTLAIKNNLSIAISIGFASGKSRYLPASNLNGAFDMRVVGRADRKRAMMQAAVMNSKGFYELLIARVSEGTNRLDYAEKALRTLKSGVAICRRASLQQELYSLLANLCEALLVVAMYSRRSLSFLDVIKKNLDEMERLAISSADRSSVVANRKLLHLLELGQS